MSIPIQVRCCCTPKKLLGHIYVDVEPPKEEVTRFPVVGGIIIPLLYTQYHCSNPRTGERETGYAFKADGHDKKALSQIPWFKPS